MGLSSPRLLFARSLFFFFFNFRFNFMSGDQSVQIICCFFLFSLDKVYVSEREG